MTQSTGQHFAVVGGGHLGASLAMALNKRGHTVELFEARPHIGGLADGWSVAVPGYPESGTPTQSQLDWDRFYHVILMSDLRLRQLLEELQLHERLQWRQTRTGFYTDGTLYSMSNSLEFLKFPPLSIIDKCRLAATIMVASRMKNWRALESVAVTDWLRRWSGNTTLDKIWRPLLKAKLGDLYSKTSAAFIWSTINRMYAARRSGLKEEMFGYVDGGYAVINDALQKHLLSTGISVKTGSKVASIDVAEQSSDDSGNQNFTVTTASGASSQYDKVVVAAHSPLIPTLCPQLSATEVNVLNSVSYLGVVCVSVVLHKPLAGYYVTNITDDWVPFTGVIEMSALVDADDLHGRGLVYLPKYMASDDPGFEQSDEEITTKFVEALRAMYPHLTDADIVATRVARARHVMAVPTLNYSEKAPPVKTSVDGLYVASTAQILFGTLNVNETLLLADNVMQQIDNDLKQPTVA